MTSETSRRPVPDFGPPTERAGPNKENEAPVLSLVQFCKPPFVTFGAVKLGSSRTAALRVHNPAEDAVAEVTVDRIPSAKGFSAERSSFVIQPESSFTLTITWTPVEEGGVRELIVFNANGVLKHQAVLLGRAEAPKKKKKSLWDSIKNKRAADPTATPRCKNNESTLKITSNKTFQVPRKSQYKREKPRSPLMQLNEGGGSIRERSLSKPRSVGDGQERQRPHKGAQRPKGLAGSDQARVGHAQENSPVLLLASAAELADLSNGSAVPLDLLGTPEHPGLTRVLNRTLSPVGTPEGFKRLMPHIQSLDSPVIEAFPAGADDDDVRGPPVDSDPQRLALALTVSDALALIDSDLHTVSTHSSSDIFSDSLDSVSGTPCPGPVAPSLDVIPDSPDPSHCNGQRCTFFVSKNTTASNVVVGPMASVHRNQEVKKTSFTSATVTKCKAAIVDVAPNLCSPGGRRIKKSRRRLLENTLELLEGSSPRESSPGTPGLPVIDSDSGAESWPRHSPATSSPHGPPTPIIFPITSLPDLSPAPTPPRFSFTATSPSPVLPHALPTFFPHQPSPVSVPLMLNESSPPAGFPLSPVCSKMSEVLPDVSDSARSPAAASSASLPSPQPPPMSQQVLMFPVHTKAQLDLAKSKKRKSDEYLRSEEKVEDVTRLDCVKRSRVAAATTRESIKSVREKKRVVEKPQRQHTSAGSVRSTSASSMKIARSVAPATNQSTLRGARSLKAFGAGPIRTAKVVAVAQAKLTFIKPAQTAIPRHPMPFAAKNMFYDERWIEKQENGFTCWINYILTPDDFKVNLEVTKVNALSIAMGSDDKYSVLKAPTKEELSFSTYTARRRLNRLRRSACQLFTSDVMVKAIQKLELEVEAKRLLVRKDRHLWKDIGERQKVLNWLLSYNPLWLRIGLETIYGELIPLESNSDTLGLAMFVLTRLLWNPDIATEFRHAKVPHLYKDGHEEALSRFTLKKLLLLVCFLDKAKESRLLEHDPCLFCMDAEFKTSKDLLLAFSRDFLSGEGILSRHLGYLGLPVSHVQTPLDEFNFAVKNLAMDLKCGIRLVRVMELFLQDWSLSRRLRLPAISRLQKVHNMDIAFQVLKAKGIDLRDEHGSTIDSRDIVDGHREKTLSLLWKIIFAFQVEVILDEDQLREEIGFLKRTLRTKQMLASLRANRGIQESTAGRGPAPGPFETGSTKISLLLEWVNAVCDYYNLRVENFTVSFSDGRVLCYLIHHYHPGSLPEQAISHSTTQTVDCSPRGCVELDCSNSDSDSSFNFQPSVQKGLESPSFEFKELLEKEKNNFRLVNSAVAFLGGVPAMINPADMSNTIPNEKVVTSYLAFLCSRLLDLRNETRAARVIQGAWRKYRLMKDLEFYQQRNVAAAKIQVLVKSFLQRRRAEREKSAAIVIQATWRGYAARNALRLKREAQRWALRHNSAMIIQAWWKMYSAKRSYQCLRYHVVVVQAQWRMRRVAIAYSKITTATTVIQRYTRAWAMARRERGRYISLRTAAVEIQRCYRRWRALRLAKEHRAAIVIQAAFRKWHMENVTQRAAAALKIQSWYRMRRSVLQYLTLRRSAVLIQAYFRGHAQRCRLQTLMLQQRSALVIQSAFRGHAVRKHLAKKRLAAVLLQRWFRACVRRNVERQRFVTLRHAAVIIQAAHRGNTARALLREQCCAVTVIQAAFRRFAAERRYLALKTATAVIQQWYRAMILAHKTRKEYGALKCSAVIIQSVWRGRADRKRLESLHEYATIIQASYRRHREQALYRSTKLAAVVLQRSFRAHMARKRQRSEYLQLKAAAITLQANFRGRKVRMQLNRRHHAAILIQSVGRMLICRKRYLLLQSATIIVQSRYRALVEGRVQQLEYQQQRLATIKIQATYRGFRVRRGLRKQHTAATAIQAHFRMYRVRMAYLATRCAAIIVQQRYRAKKLGDQQVQRYTAIRSAAVIIQAGYRGHMVRQKLSELHRAATVIKRWFQASRDRRRFLSIKATALLFQRTYRAIVQTRKIHSDYLLRRRAAISLQAAYRGMKARQQLGALHKAAVKIQSVIRMFLQRTYYKKLHWATTTVQCYYRINKKMREKILTLNVQKNAAVVLQAAFRGMKTRQGVRRMRQAASAIQRGYRAHCKRKQYLALKSSALTLQRQFRANLAAKRQLQQYQQIRGAVILLQAAYRGQQVRKEISHQHHAATVIQASFRKHREQVKFQAMRLSTIIIQRYYRSCVLQRADRGHFLKVKQSAIILQAAFRGMASRRKTNQMHQAAKAIQLAYRAHCERKVYLALKSSALNLQQRFRANVAAKYQLQQYRQMRRAVISLQAAYRGQQVRKEISRQHQAATVIQASFRKHREQVKFQAMRLSTIIIQRYYRSCVLQRADRGQFLMVKQAAIILQAAFRGHCVRNNISKMQRAATVIQVNYRRYKQQSCFRRRRWAALVIQQRFRAQRLQNLDAKKYQRIRRATVTLQAAFRGMKARQAVRRMHQAASAIQLAYRAHCEHQSYLILKSSALTLQRQFRANLAAIRQLQQYQQIRGAVILLQAAYRGQQVRKEISRQHQAATVIQASFRKHREQVKFQAMRLSTIIIQRYYRSCVLQRADRGHFLKVKQSAVILQAAFRGMASRRKTNQMHQAAKAIQLAYRGHCERKVYLALKSSALNLQRRFRANVAAKHQLQQYRQIRRAVISFQAAYRGQQVRKEISRQHHAATVIQASFRKHREQVKFQAMRLSTIIIQRYYRSCVLQRADRGHFLKVKQSTLILQAAFRRHFTRRAIVEQNHAATLIQSHWRSLVQRRTFRRQREAAMTLQRILRAVWLARATKQHYTRKRLAAITLQAHFRGWIARRQLLEAAKAEKRRRFIAAAFHHISAMKIQRALRAHWALQSAKKEIHSVIAIQRWLRARQQRRRYVEERRKVVIVQRMVRQWLAHRHQAAAVIQHAARRFLLLRRQQRVLQGVIKAQALWRGHCSRKLSDDPKLVAVRHRLRKVSVGVREEDKLGNKTASALDYLLRYKHFSYILEALKNLDTATRLSPECCERLVESGATLVIFTLIRCCNRSVPCMDVITSSIQILLNLSKYHKTVEAVYAVENSVETLLGLLQRYREKAGDKVADKGGSLFTKACFLLALLLQDRHRALEVSKLPKALDRIRSIYRLTARKYKMDTERTIVKHKMNASTNSSFLVQATPRKSQPVRRFAPDWVLKKDKLRDIVDPLGAIKMVADTFSIVL